MSCSFICFINLYTNLLTNGCPNTIKAPLIVQSILYSLKETPISCVYEEIVDVHCTYPIQHKKYPIHSANKAYNFRLLFCCCTFACTLLVGMGLIVIPLYPNNTNKKKSTNITAFAIKIYSNAILNYGSKMSIKDIINMYKEKEN